MSDEDKKKKVLEFFAQHHIPYRLYEHPAFFTVAEAHAYRDSHGSVFHTPGVVGCKNLFLKTYTESSRSADRKALREKSGHEQSESEDFSSRDFSIGETRYYLYVLPDDARADLKAFAKHVGEKKVTFASPEELMHFLGVTPGSVSLCGVLNDTNRAVRVYIDSRVHSAPMLHLHPNINTASLELTNEAYSCFLEALARPISVYTERGSVVRSE